MKKLSKIHPSLPAAVSDQFLSLLPATILTLTVTLSPQDREVLAYLISCSAGNSNSGKPEPKPKTPVSGGGGGGSGGDHPLDFRCNCFRCYMGYWVRWNNSPNRELIHEIIDAYEDGLFQKSNGVKSNKKQRRKRNSNPTLFEDEKKDNLKDPKMAEVTFQGDVEEKGEKYDEVRDIEKGSVGKIVSYLGERILGVWGI